MMSFRGRNLVDLSLPAGLVWMLNEIAEAKGRQELYTRQAPQVLKALRDTALIQSAESSNRIEGVTVEPDRLRPLVIGNVRPRDRSEEEVQNYRKALSLIHTSAADLLITPETLQLLHRTAQEGAGDAGQWKRVNNDIVEVYPGKSPRLRFRTVSAQKTPGAIEELCLAYRHLVEQYRIPALVLTGCLIFDFLCVHPFRDGNGRVSRLLTLLGLYQHGFDVGRYVSLEKLIEETRDDYYEALRRSSAGGHDGKHDVMPWLNYFVTIVRRAYRTFEERAGQVKSPRGAKTALVEQAIKAQLGEFTVGELERLCPGVTRDLIRRVLQEWRQDGRVTCQGRGPGSRWRRKG